MSVHFGAESSTLDLDTESLPQKTLLAVEQLANAAITEPRAVTVSFEDAATVTGLRKPPPREGELRVVTIDALDRSACGGTHVRSTAEIGSILLRGTERVRKTTRVEFICGLRAVRAARADHELISALALSLGVAPSELVAKTKAQGEELRAAQARASRGLDRARWLSRARALRRHRPRCCGRSPHRACVANPERSTSCGRLAQAVSRSGTRDSSARLRHHRPSCSPISGGPAALDAGAVLKAVLAQHGGRGGGNARIAQGTVPSLDALDAAVAAL